MLHRMRTVIWGVLLALVACKGGESKEDPAKADRQKKDDEAWARAKSQHTEIVSLFEKLGALAKPAPALTGKFTAKLDDTNTIVLPADAAERKKILETGFASNAWFSPGKSESAAWDFIGARNFTADHTAEHAWAKAAKYVAFVTHSELERPGRWAVDSFPGGRVSGEVHAYEIASGTYVGGAWFSATSSKTLSVRGAPDPNNVISEDFARNAGAAVRNALVNGGTNPAATPSDPPAAFPIKFPDGWVIRKVDKPGVIIMAADGTDAATARTAVVIQFPSPVQYDTKAACAAIAAELATSTKGKVAFADAEPSTKDIVGTCKIGLDRGARFAHIVIFEAPSGPPYYLSCEGLDSDKGLDDVCGTIWNSIDL